MKRITATLYTETKAVHHKHGTHAVSDSPACLYSGGRFQTHILPTDLPEWYVYGTMNKRQGYISARGVKHLLYVPDFSNETQFLKSDLLFVSYSEPIVPVETEGVKWYGGYDHVLDGQIILDFVNAVGIYSSFDVGSIRKEIELKMKWFNEHNGIDARPVDSPTE